MKNNINKTFVLVLALSLVFLGAVAQRNAQRDSNPFLNRDYWEKQPSISTIEATIKDGHSPTETNRGGFDATTFAIFGKNPIGTIQFLLDQGNDVNKRTHDSRNYVFWAASSGDLDLVKYLIDKGSKLDIVDSHGYGPISFTAAGRQQNTAIYDALIAGGADLQNEKDHHGKNALLVAISRVKDLKLVDYFIKKGLDIHSTDDRGNGIFNYAAKGGNIDILKQLITRGVSTEKNEETGENAIFFASKGSRSSNNFLEVFQYLEGIGLNANVITKEGVTPLHNLAWYNEDIQLFDYFTSKGVDPNAVDKEGNTALSNSARRNKLAVVKYFTEKTKDIDHVNKEGKTALSIAVKNNNADVVSYLISRGADVNTVDSKGRNLAFYLFDTRGIPRDFDAKVEALKTAGLDFMKPQPDQRTVWHMAMDKNNMELLKKVQAFGADINAKDEQGNTVLHYAAMKSTDTKILKYLLANGADVNSTTEFGETAYELAQENELLAKTNVNLDFLN